VAFFLPVAQLAAWASETIAEDTLDPNLARSLRNTVILGMLAATVAVVTATMIAVGQRAYASRVGTVSTRLATIGYAVPGTVVAVAVYVPLVAFDRRAAHWAEDVLGVDTGLLFTGTILGLPSCASRRSPTSPSSRAWTRSPRRSTTPHGCSVRTARGSSPTCTSPSCGPACSPAACSCSSRS
jgi:hypothetical protein